MLKFVIQYLHFEIKINEITINVAKKLNLLSNINSAEKFLAKNICNVLKI